MSGHSNPAFSSTRRKPLGNCVQVKFRMMSSRPRQSKFCAGNQLDLYKSMDILRFSEQLHQFSKSSRLRISRKHGIVHHSQRRTVVLDKFAGLTRMILKLDYGTTSFLIGPEVNTCFGGYSHKDTHASHYPFFFGFSVYSSTCITQREISKQKSYYNRLGGSARLTYHILARCRHQL